MQDEGDGEGGAEDGEVRVASVQEPGDEREECADEEAPEKDLVFAAEEICRSYEPPDYRRAVEDLRLPPRPLCAAKS